MIEIRELRKYNKQSKMVEYTVEDEDGERSLHHIALNANTDVEAIILAACGEGESLALGRATALAAAGLTTDADAITKVVEAHQAERKPVEVTPAPVEVPPIVAVAKEGTP